MEKSKKTHSYRTVFESRTSGINNMNFLPEILCDKLSLACEQVLWLAEFTTLCMWRSSS